MRIRLALLLCAACGGRTMWPGDADLYGAQLVVEAGTESYTTAPDFRPRLRNILTQTAALLGQDPGSFAGMRLVIRASAWGCTDLPPYSPGCSGFYSEGDNTMIVTTGTPAPGITRCPENMAIPHEAVHYFFGDWNHQQRAEFCTWYFTPLWNELHAGTNGCDYVVLPAGTVLNPYDGLWAGRHDC